jgi:phytoene synthase
LEWFEEIINGMQMDLNQTRYQRFDDLKLYCFRVAGAVGLLAAKIFGYTDERVVQYAETLGLAFQLTNIIRDIREDADRGRIYLPLEDLQEFDVTENEILSHQHNTKIKKLLTKQVQRTQSIYDQAFTFLPEGERYTQRCGIIMSALYRKILFVIEKDIESVLDKRVSLSPLNKLWIAWKTARDEKKRHKKSLLTCDA